MGESPAPRSHCLVLSKEGQMITAGMVFQAIAGAIKAIPLIDGWFQQIMTAWMDGQSKATHSAIVDAAAFASRAVTDADRYAAAEKWRKALSRSRIMQ